MSMGYSRAEAAGADGALNGPPQEYGWAIWSGGVCSITRCVDRAVAAIERTRGMRRPPYWQTYCEEHARARGVELRGEDLGWTTEFLQPRDH